ncbi:hypothetical protein LMG032447_01231 [Convivina praedatoris]|uniref:Type I restriction modification DNA specificity domain-containing protein n=2 Tax=Convivina praedatoris TaxID=2880963 RepID=A0ABN8HEV7_9LACO|nr:hypothetical protein R077815_01222 [Convivina sp. LMG 32447]CAH1856114.1 hypothetical protein LMG032447_01231 [Convivina sp. LMG 32447]
MGDLVVADASEDYQGIAEPSIILELPSEKLVAGLHTIALQPKLSDGLFLYYLLHTDSFKHFGYKNGTGLKIFGISWNSLSNFEVEFPGVLEQKQISKLLLRLEQLITVNQRELKTLRRLLNPGTCIISVKFFNLKRMLNMTYLINILSIVVAIEFFYIMYLETFATQSKRTGRVFDMSSEKLADKNIQTLFKNQGIYNGLLGIGIIYSMFLLPSMLLPIMIYIIAVALYGSFSSGNKSIVFKQAGLAMVVTLLLLLH